MRISYWSSAVCSSDLHPAPAQARASRYLAVPATAMAHHHAPSADGGMGRRPRADLALRLLVHPKVCCKGGTKSRLKNDITQLHASSEASRVGKGCISPCQSRCEP